MQRQIIRLTKSACLIFACIFIGFSCSTDKTGDWKEHDLISYGIPITIMGPDSLEVEKKGFAGQVDVTVKGPGDYRLQIFSSDATSSKVDNVLQGLKETVEGNQYFTEYILDEEDGFIYSLTIDETHIFYGFRRVKIRGGKEFVIQNNLLGVKSEEFVKKLYYSLKE